MFCGARSDRTRDGDETDEYRCRRGHAFGIDWSWTGMPTASQWPRPAGSPPTLGEALADELTGLGWDRRLAEEILTGSDPGAIEQHLLAEAPAAVRAAPDELARVAGRIHAAAQALGRPGREGA